MEVKIKNYEAKSRLIEILSRNKKLDFPSYFPQIARKTDMRDIMDASVRLEILDEKRLAHIGGVVMEAHSTPSIIDKNLVLIKQSRLFQRIKGNEFAHFFEFLKEYNILFLIDPNIDRLDIYSEPFLNLRTDFFTTEIIDFIKSKKSERINKLLENLDFVRRVLEFQIKYKADELITPYIAINVKTFETDLSTNVKLYQLGADLTSRFFTTFNPPLCCICIDKNILSITSADRRNEIWGKIVDSYANINAPIFLIKISDFNTASMDEKYDEILDFFRLVKSKIDKPIIFLNMNEFAYVLFREGLDGFYCRISRPTGRDMPIGRNIPSEERAENMHGLYYIPRKMWLVKRAKINKIELPCGCPFCRIYKGVKINDIPDEEWKKLRIYHYLWIKNDEIRQLIDEMKKNCLRAALLSMFSDSENWKKFVKYI